MFLIYYSEYMEKHTVSRLLGAPPGYVGHDEGGAFEAVRRKPYSVVLLDEMEKAHRDVANVLLQVLDDGHITDSKGRKIDFRNTIIVMTSNLGAELLADTATVPLSDGAMDPQRQLLIKERVLEVVRRHFSPEFVNRIDELITFNRLSQHNLKEIVDVRLRELEQRLVDKHMRLELDEAAHQWLANNGYDPVYGARPLNRLIQHKLLNPLARLILDGGVRDGEMVKVTVDHVKDELVVVRNHKASSPSLVDDLEDEMNIDGFESSRIDLD